MFGDGVILSRLLLKIDNTCIDEININPKPSVPIEKTSNIDKCFEGVKKLGVDLGKFIR